MNVVSKRGLRKLAEGKGVDATTRRELEKWVQAVRAARWTSIEDVRRLFADADSVGRWLVFNVRHNRYRLIVAHTFPRNRLYVKALLTHKEYDREKLR